MYLGQLQSQRATVTAFRGGRSVRGVITDTPVSNVRVVTGDYSAIFVPPQDLSQHAIPPQVLPQQPLVPSSSPITPIKVERLLKLLSGYTPSTVNYLYSGFSKGFPLHFEGDIVSFEAENLLSAREHPDIVSSKIDKELEAHRLAGPFHSSPFAEFRVSPLGVVPKKAPGEFRMIHHLSYPHGSSVNDGILPENTAVHYATIVDAIRLIKQNGKGCFLAKTDIKNAFRIIPIQASDSPLLGMKWDSLYYYDRCMPMGCSSSCKTFETFSTAVEWIAQTKIKIPSILHLLDDFLIVAPTHSLCSRQLQLFLNLYNYLGIPMVPEKTVGPLSTLSFAGIELDSIAISSPATRQA